MLVNKTPNKPDYGALSQDSSSGTTTSDTESSDSESSDTESSTTETSTTDSSVTETFSFIAHGTELNDIYADVGLGPAQYMAWAAVALMGYSDYAELTILSVVMPTLRCEWDLSSEFEAAIAISMYVAYAASAMLFGKVADVHGRKPVCLISTLILLVVTIGCISAPNKWVFLFCRVVAGGCIGVNWTVDMCYATEFSESKYRTTGVAVGNLSSLSSMAMVCAGALAVLNIVGWRLFVLIMSLPLLPTIAIILWLPDSPRYLCVSGQMEKAVKAVRFMARLNGKKLPDNLIIRCHEKEDLRVRSCMVLLTQDNRRFTLSLSSIFLANAYVGFGLILFFPLMLQADYCGFNTQPSVHECDPLSQKDLLQLTIASGICVLAVVCATFTVNTVGRLTPLRIACGVQIVAIGMLFVCMGDVGKVVVAAFASAVNVIVSLVLWVIIPESYPTNIRSSAIGFINGWGRIGGVLASGSIYLWMYSYPHAILGMFVIMTVLAFMSTLPLNKETKDVVLRDTWCKL